MTSTVPPGLPPPLAPNRPEPPCADARRGVRAPASITPVVSSEVVPRPPSRSAAPRLRAGLVRDRDRGEVLHGEGPPLRLGPWQGDPLTAYVVPVHSGTPCAAGDIRRALDLLTEQGFRSVVTAALAPLDQAAFLAVGFDVRERLHLLARDLPPAPAPAVPRDVGLRRGHGQDRDVVLAVDHQAFEPFWQLDGRGLADAIAATPSARFRVAVTQRGPRSELLGYSVIGRAAHRGYIQRLAVTPARHRAGVGRALLVDGLRWLERRRVRRVMVNTQERNAAALGLYERAGFERQPGGLAVLSRSLGEPT
mgnify:CR=1 FL=1